MSFAEDLRQEVRGIVRSPWTVRTARQVPDVDSVALADNDAVELTATVLYADLVASTDLVDSVPPKVAAKVYKSFLRVASIVIGETGGAIRAFDGDRVMAVYLHEQSDAAAVSAALYLNTFVPGIVVPELQSAFPTLSRELSIRHAAGIDRGPLFVARTGKRGSSDLVWVGPAANHAAKQSEKRVTGANIFISKQVYDLLPNELKFRKATGLFPARIPIWSRPLLRIGERVIYQTSARL